jgi:hypothetical protein
VARLKAPVTEDRSFPYFANIISRRPMPCEEKYILKQQQEKGHLD